MKTPKELYPEKRIIYHPELSACPHCDSSLKLHNYLAWDKTVQTLNKVLSVASRPGYCSNPVCCNHGIRLLSGQGQQVAPWGSTYGYDVLVHIGWLRQEGRATYAEIQAALWSQVCISQSHVRYLYQQVYLPLLACNERQHWGDLDKVAHQHGGLLISLDGLVAEGGQPQLWFMRELLTGLTLRSGWLSRVDQPTFEAFLAPLKLLDWPVLAVLSDKQRGLVPAVAAVLPDARHQFCQPHYLRNLAEPLTERDTSFKVALRKAVRKEVGDLVRLEKPADSPQNGLLTITGMLPDAQQPALETPASPSTDTVQAAEVVTQVLRHTRYLLTLTGRPPLRLAGVETYQRLQKVVKLSTQLLAHRHEQQLSTLSTGLQSALSQHSALYQELQQGASWLQDIAHILEPSSNHPSNGERGEQVAQHLRTYLDGLLSQPSISPQLDALRLHLDKVSGNYWPGLFHCYDLQGLPRTNNGLESHFRDTIRRLLRSNGQRGLTRRTLHRYGAWELFPRPPTERQRLQTLRQIPADELAKEQRRLQEHRKRFRLHTRSTRQVDAQFTQLRQQWFALPPASTG
jgi:hypothetical protein